MLEAHYSHISSPAFRSSETPDLGLPLQHEADLLVCLDCNSLGLHWFSSGKPGAASVLELLCEGTGWRRAVDAAAVQTQLYLL